VIDRVTPSVTETQIEIKVMSRHKRTLSVSTLDTKTYEPSCAILTPMRNYKPAKVKIFMTKSMHQNIGALPARVNSNSSTEDAVKPSSID
jgi:hypothetical protein